MLSSYYVKRAIKSEAPPTTELKGRLIKMTRVVHAIFGLMTEVGEFTDIFKRHIFYGTEIDRVRVEEELGDIFWYIAIILDFFGLDAGHIMGKNLNKLQGKKGRYKKGFNEEEATNRDLDQEYAQPKVLSLTTTNSTFAEFASLHSTQTILQRSAPTVAPF